MMDFQAGTAQNLGKAADAGGLLAIDNDQAGDRIEVDIFGAGEARQVVRMPLDEIAHPLLLRAGKGEQRTGIELKRRRHGAQAVKIGIGMGSDNVHGHPTHPETSNVRIISDYSPVPIGIAFRCQISSL